MIKGIIKKYNYYIEEYIKTFNSCEIYKDNETKYTPNITISSDNINRDTINHILNAVACTLNISNKKNNNCLNIQEIN